MLDLVAELYVAEHAANGQSLVGASKLEFRKEHAGQSASAGTRGCARKRNGIHPEPNCCRYPLRRKPVNRARRFSRRRASSARQQRLRVRIAACGARKKKLFLVLNSDAGESLQALPAAGRSSVARIVNSTANLVLKASLIRGRVSVPTAISRTFDRRVTIFDAGPIYPPDSVL